MWLRVSSVKNNKNLDLSKLNAYTEKKCSWNYGNCLKKFGKPVRRKRKISKFSFEICDFSEEKVIFPFHNLLHKYVIIIDQNNIRLHYHLLLQRIFAIIQVTLKLKG